MSVASPISPQALKALLNDDSQFTLIDVRGPGEYNSTHIPDSSVIYPSTRCRHRAHRCFVQWFHLKSVNCVFCAEGGLE